MYHKIPYFLSIFLFFIAYSITVNVSHAQDMCDANNRTCIIEELLNSTQDIENKAWRDQTYREIAKTKAFEGDFENAVLIIDQIQTPDTKAMTIRGIGMAIAAQDHTQDDLHQMFSRLRTEADTISHPPSYAIALTYISMSQAFAGDNEGAWKTAADMENSALRNKAYGETAEIQAEKGDFTAAKTSIEKIDSLSFRNKAYSITSGIFADSQMYAAAYKAAHEITNSYKKAQSLQYMLDQQKPRDTKH